MLLNSFYAILGTFYTLLNNTDLDLSYFDLSYVFPGHSDSVERGLTVFLKVLKVPRPGRKTSGFQTVRILKICPTSGPDVMSGRAHPRGINIVT